MSLLDMPSGDSVTNRVCSMMLGVYWVDFLYANNATRTASTTTSGIRFLGFMHNLHAIEFRVSGESRGLQL